MTRTVSDFVAFSVSVAQLGLHVLDVLLEFQDDVHRVAHQLGVEPIGVQQQQRARPVDRLADRRHFLQVQLAQAVDEAHQLRAQLRRNLRHARIDDALLELDVRERNVQVQAAPLQRVGDLARVVARQEHQRRLAARALTVPISGIETW